MHQPQTVHCIKTRHIFTLIHIFEMYSPERKSHRLLLYLFWLSYNHPVQSAAAAAVLLRFFRCSVFGGGMCVGLGNSGERWNSHTLGSSCICSTPSPNLPHRTYKGDVLFVEHSALRAVLVFQAPGPARRHCTVGQLG